MIRELETRFSNNYEGLVAVQYLVPSHLSHDKVESIEHFYGKFLSYEEMESLVPN